MLTRERHAIVTICVDGGDISGVDRSHAGEVKGVGKGVGMAQLPAQYERAIGGPGGPIRIAVMPKRQGQLDKGADPDVLPVAKGVIAMLGSGDFFGESALAGRRVRVQRATAVMATTVRSCRNNR